MTPLEEILLLTLNRTGGISMKLPIRHFLEIIGKADCEETEAIIKSPYFHSILMQYGYAFWISRTDGEIRLVDLNKMRLRQYCGPKICRLCLIDEPDSRCNLVMDSDRDGNIVENSFVHALCRPKLRKLRAQEQWSLSNG